MSIQPDHWIRKMALEQGMIEPFVDRQVRDGVISYGLSSYGYDIRVADEFRIFTPGLGDLTVVDPKRFDARSMVDYQGSVCVIPPNSFALARTVEFFRIPRNVLTLCLGKSTYARCFRGDTRVALVDGTAPTLEEMARRAEQGESFWGYSIGENGRLIVTLLDAPRYIGRDSLVQVVLDNRETIFCTPDHLFMLRDGRWQAAGELTPGSSLMPLYRTRQSGYEMVYQPLHGHLYPTHRLADEWNVRHGVYSDQPGTHRQHLDFDRLNNNPWNLARREVWSENDACAQGERAQRRWNEAEHAEKRAQWLAARRNPWEQTRQAQREAALSHYQVAAKRTQRFPAMLREFRGQSAPDNHKVAGVRSLPGDHDVFCLSVPEAGNFALASGVFVHNCGIIVNVTPFEPEWCGYATLEISNTTPLPAKIYANEGIAQVLFFQGDPPEQSYADKRGKYQNQVGITLPRL